MDKKELIRAALKARKLSYSPYSNFQVGAALLAADKTVFTGCNVENAAYSPGCCAERTAFVKAVSEGRRDFLAIVIAGGGKDAGRLDYCAPCGVCRQVMREFCRPEEFRVILAKTEEEYQEYTLAQLLPLGFGPENLERS